MTSPQILRRRGSLGCRQAAALLVGLFCGPPLFAGRAHAYEQVTIRDWRAPMSYEFELEPHLVLGTAPPGPGYGTGVGIGVRGSVVILPDGFIPRVNDSVAVGVGLDIGHYTASWAVNGYRDQCLHYEPGPAGTSICTDVTSNGGTYNYWFVPVVMQWNFWLTHHFSAFGEPGVDIYYVGSHGVSVTPAVYVGGRVKLNERITLTGRLGYPTVAIGVSFMM
jgi:hypothetical protein